MTRASGVTADEFRRAVLGQATVAAAAQREATVERDRWIRLAAKKGAGLREIARAVDMSASGVRKIIDRT